MLIRREDKELIHNLALLGALFGACICVFLAVHLSNQAHEQDKQHSEYKETSAALVKLSSSAVSPETPVVEQDILKQVQEHIQQEKPDTAETSQKNFWLELPRWGFWGVCAGSSVVGAIAGFSTIWMTGWGGSVFVFVFIRLLYKVIRKIAPNSTAARLTEQQQTQQVNHLAFQRDRQRIFPSIVKLLFLLLLALGALAIVVWKVTGL